MTELKRDPEVSVIVPVYNVGAYLDICMDSLVRQTFADMEILLINDGSTDDSGDRCRKWADSDKRIRFIDKENEGVAASRNLGVREARGKYLAFIDPDDWIDPEYMEKLHRRLEETGADFAECDLWRYDNRTGRKIYRACYGQMGREYTLREHMKYGPTATYKSMSRRSLWTKYGIRMPDCSFESPAIYALVLALSGKVESIREPLYYYRRFRENSLIENGYAGRDGQPNNTLGIEAMSFLVSEFERCGIIEEYRGTLEGVVKYRLNDILAMQFHRKPEKDFRELVENCRRFLGETFPGGHNEKYFTWGGYNLCSILTHMNWLHDPSCRFGFSSIAGICSEPDPYEPEICHKNRYRHIMLDREKGQVFWHMLESEKPEFLFMDLIEERFDLMARGNHIITKSDAFESAETERTAGNDVLIRRNSETCKALWKKSADIFFTRVRKAVPGIRIVIVENYLSEYVGDLKSRKPFPDAERIREINALLKEYYEYAEKVCPEAVVLRPADDPLYFTDEKFEYGSVPSHLNAIINRKIAEALEKILGKDSRTLTG